jgi:hypothetical protein
MRVINAIKANIKVTSDERRRRYDCQPLKQIGKFIKETGSNRLRAGTVDNDDGDPAPTGSDVAGDTLEGGRR